MLFFLLEYDEFLLGSKVSLRWMAPEEILARIEVQKELGQSQMGGLNHTCQIPEFE